MSRDVHFCGSLPPELVTNDTDVMRWFAEHTHGHRPTALPTTQDPNWIVQYLKDHAQRPVFETTKPGELTSYDDFPGYRVRDGETLRPADVAHTDIATTLAQIEQFYQFRRQHPELENAQLMLPVPHPIDLSLFTFVGPTLPRLIPSPVEVQRALRHLPVFTNAVVQHITDVTWRHGRDVLWHLEAPSALIGMHKARIARGASRLFSAWHSRHTATWMSRLPRDTRMMLHLCYGNHRNKEAARPTDLTTPVVYLNQLARQLHRRGVDLPPVHIPAAFGGEAPPVNPAFYAPLANLHNKWDVIAGVASEADQQASAAALRLFERAAGREATAVGCACGLGRRNTNEAEQAALTMSALADIEHQGTVK